MPSFLTSIYRADDLFSSLSTRTPTSPLLRSGYYRPWRNTALTRQDSGSTLNLDKDKFQIILDVQQFTPEEITVKTTDKYVVVEGKHEEKQDEHGFVSRHFTRRYMLPSMNLIRKNYKPSAIYQLFLYICLLPNRRSRPKWHRFNALIRWSADRYSTEEIASSSKPGTKCAHSTDWTTCKGTASAGIRG